MEFEIVAEGCAFPEGPVTFPDGSVIFCEILGGTLKRAWGDGRVEMVASPGGGPNGAQLGPDGALYVCNNGGIDTTKWRHRDDADAVGRIERIDLATGRVDRLYESCGEHRLRAPNDLVFDAQGGIWFTDMGKTGDRNVDKSGLYYARPDGSSIVEASFGGVSYNGIALSADETALYVMDTRPARVWKFALDGPGSLTPPANPHQPGAYVATVPGNTWLDSCAMTEAGNLCIGTLHQGGITTLRPDGTTEHVAFPDPFVTNIAFGGGDRRTAYITLSVTGRVVKARWPEPGLALNFAEY